MATSVSGLLATVVSLRINGLDLDLDDNEARELTISVAAGELSADEIEKLFRTRPAQR